jgi:hypothetical protein
VTPDESRALVDGLAIETRHGQSVRPLPISVVDAAKVLGINRQLLDERVAPRLTTVRIGRRRLGPTIELDRYVNDLIAEAETVTAVERPASSTMADRTPDRRAHRPRKPGRKIGKTC